MGKEKTVVTNESSQTQRATPTAEETRLNQLQLQDYEASQGARQKVNASGLNLADLLLTGKPLPGYLGSLPGGISEDVVGDITKRSLADVNTQLAASGAGSFLESGPSQSIGANTAAGIRNQAAQFNLEGLRQLINLAVGGQAVPMGYAVDIGGQLGGRLAGLRSISSAGTNTQTTLAMNPFMRSFQTSLGQSLGSPSLTTTGGFRLGAR